jgi:hypothetical protein
MGFIRLAANPHGTDIGFYDPAQDLDERRLARAVLPQEGMHFAGPKLDRNVLKRDSRAVGLRYGTHIERADRS